MTTKSDYQQVLSILDMEKMFDLLKRMLSFPSYSRSKEESDLAFFLQEYLQEMGLDVHLQEVEPDRYNVIARKKGTGGGKTLLFNGHMDVNPPALGWTKDPFAGVIENGWIHGIGVVNMKAGGAAFITAAEAVLNSGIDLKGDLILSLVVGELQGGIGTLTMLEKGITADAFILAEPTELMLLLKHYGMVHLTITVIGRSCHISSIEKGVSAIDSMYEVISAIRKSALDANNQLFARFNVGSIKGGLTDQYHTWRPSLVADHCTATCDFRIPPGQTEETLLAGIRKIAEYYKEDKAGLDIRVDLVEPPAYYHMPPLGVDENEPIVALVKENHKYVTGMDAAIADSAPQIFYADDASHLYSKGNIPGVVYGPGGATVSQPDERVAIEDVITAAKVYALSILKYCS